jgi:hypothetical protein
MEATKAMALVAPTTFANTTVNSNRTQFNALEDALLDWYTVRINTWKRPDQLQISVRHYLTCTGVAQVQVIWCTAQGPVPKWLRKLQRQTHGARKGSRDIFVSRRSLSESGMSEPDKLVVEEHGINSLNERFRVLAEPPTYAVLSVDDDVLAPCEALDAGFLRWQENPDRMVGFEPRSHSLVDRKGRRRARKGDTLDETNSTWGYERRKKDRISLVLTKFAFLHKDYLKSYMGEMPSSIRDHVDSLMNCEDLAMSLWVSSRTGGLAPLLADTWAYGSMVKLYSDNQISVGSAHDTLRDNCVDRFATELNLKQRLRLAILTGRPLYDCDVRADPNLPSTAKQQHRGADALLYPTVAGHWAITASLVRTIGSNICTTTSSRWQSLSSLLAGWKKRQARDIDIKRDLKSMKKALAAGPSRLGLIEKTGAWKKRFDLITPK